MHKIARTLLKKCLAFRLLISDRYRYISLPIHLYRHLQEDEVKGPKYADFFDHPHDERISNISAEIDEDDANDDEDGEFDDDQGQRGTPDSEHHSHSYVLFIT